MDFGCYLVNWSLWLNGRPETVYATGNHLKPQMFPKVEDHATIILNYKDGVAILEASWDLPPAQRTGNEIYGMTGSIVGNMIRKPGQSTTRAEPAETPGTQVAGGGGRAAQQSGGGGRGVQQGEPIAYMVYRIKSKQPLDGPSALDLKRIRAGSAGSGQNVNQGRTRNPSAAKVSGLAGTQTKMGGRGLMNYTYLQVAKMIDHSLLNPVLTDQELEAGCRLALEYDVASACVKPYYLKRCADLLAGSTVAASTVIGFPHGGHTTAIKVAEVEQALRDGGGELDMVVNIGKVLSEDWDYVRQDIQAAVEVTHHGGGLIKVIFENCYLQDHHKIALCEICAEVGADFVKTSTGYGGGGATIADLKLMRKHSPPHVRVKAAGGIRTLDGLLEVRAIGVSRSGATRTAEMLTECKQRLEADMTEPAAQTSAKESNR